MCYNDSQSFTQTPAKATINVSPGFIIVASKWRGTELCSVLQGNIQILYEDNLGSMDFVPTNHMGVVFATEMDIVAQSSVRRKLAKLRKENKLQILVVAEKTVSNSQYYQNFQKFVVMELGFQITPVPSQKEAGGILNQIVQNEGRQENNPFNKKKKNENLDNALLETLLCVPKLGRVKAKQLLDRFCSLQAISTASLQDLAQVVGKASAQNVKSFLEMWYPSCFNKICAYISCLVKYFILLSLCLWFWLGRNAANTFARHFERLLTTWQCMGCIRCLMNPERICYSLCCIIYFEEAHYTFLKIWL